MIDPLQCLFLVDAGTDNEHQCLNLAKENQKYCWHSTHNDYNTIDQFEQKEKGKTFSQKSAQLKMDRAIRRRAIVGKRRVSKIVEKSKAAANKEFAVLKKQFGLTRKAYNKAVKEDFELPGTGNCPCLAGLGQGMECIGCALPQDYFEEWCAPPLDEYGWPLDINDLRFPLPKNTLEDEYGFQFYNPNLVFACELAAGITEEKYETEKLTAWLEKNHSLT